METTFIEEKESELEISNILDIPDDISFAQLRQQEMFLEEHLRTFIMPKLNGLKPFDKHFNLILQSGYDALELLEKHQIKVREMMKHMNVLLSH